MNPNLRQGLEKFLAAWLEKLKRNGSHPRNPAEIQQAFLDDLEKCIGQFEGDQNWDKIFAGIVEPEE